MDWLGRTTGRGKDGGREEPASTGAVSGGSGPHTTTAAKGTPLLAAPPFFGHVASSTSTRREASTTEGAGAGVGAALSASSSLSSTKAFFADIGESFRDSSASLGALLSNARDAVSLLPPPASASNNSPAVTTPTVAAAAPAPADASGAVARAKARLAGLRLVVVQEGEVVEAGQGPFRIGPRTVVVAQAGDRPLPEEGEGEGEEECSVVIEWFRSAPSGALTPIPGLGTRTTRYHPTADDTGACIAVRASLLTLIGLGSRSASLQDGQAPRGQTQQQGPPFAVFAEAGPFAPDEPTTARLQQHLAARTPLVVKGLREPGNAHLVYELVVGPAGVELWSRPALLGKVPAPVSKKTVAKTKRKKATAVMLPSPAAPPRQPLKEREPWSSSLSSDDEDDGSSSSSGSGSDSGSDSDDEEGGHDDNGAGRAELVGRGSYSRETLVALHPGNPAAVLVQMPLFLLPASPAAVAARAPPAEERTEEPEAGLLVQRALEVGDGERDLLALLWRAWRTGALGEGEGAVVRDAVLLAAQLKEEEGQGQRPAIVMRAASEEAAAVGEGVAVEQEEGAPLVKSCRLSDSGSASASASNAGGEGEDTTASVEEAPAAAIRRLQREVSDAREQLVLERQQSQQQHHQQHQHQHQQHQQQHQHQHLRRASSTSNSGAVGGGGGGLGGFLGMRRASAEERDREETIRVLKREVEALHARVGELEAGLLAAEDAAAEARDQLAEAAGRAASLGEEAERLRVQEEALGLQRASNEQALALARGEMERLRAEAAGLRDERDKDRAYFVGEAREQALRLEAAEAALIEREREVAEARKELAWAHEQWSGAQAAIAKLEEECAKLKQEVKVWEEREQRRREQRRREQQLELQERQRQQQLEATNPFSPVSPGELLEESRAQCKAAEARAAALEARAEAEAAAGAAAREELGAARQALAAEREHTAVLLGERNSFRQRADSLARELGRVATRSLSLSLSHAGADAGAGSQQPQQQTAPLPPPSAVPRTFDEAATQLAAARAEAQRLREELEEVKALGAVASFGGAPAPDAAPHPQPQTVAGVDISNGGGGGGGRPPSLRAMAAGAAGALRRKSSGGGGGSGLALFRLGSRDEERSSDGSTATAAAPSLLRRERSGSGFGGGEGYVREAEMQRLLRSLTQSVQEKETALGLQRDRLRRLEALAREQGVRFPEGWEEEEQGEREGLTAGASGDDTPRTVDV